MATNRWPSLILNVTAPEPVPAANREAAAGQAIAQVASQLCLGLRVTASNVELEVGTKFLACVIEFTLEVEESLANARTNTEQVDPTRSGSIS